MPDRKRCAIYTRKSTEEGLDQDFNSLDAQRESCAAYILSQAGEGWEAVAERYDDGGWSGGNMDRPALCQLMADVEAGKVDVIVVYKVDRLTRSLADFAKIVEVLDRREACFVSVTQAFNTTTSMGRLTLNVLLSFAQFEREVTGERIRDKIAASKRKGMWMGGPVPLGYRVEQRKLVVDPAEAVTVQHIFRRYLELGSVPALVDDLARTGYRTRERVMASGRILGNVCFGRGPLGIMLRNPAYIGKVRHKALVHDGEHDAIIDDDTFAAVQHTLQRNNRVKVVGIRSARPSLLTGILTDPDGRPMSPGRAKKGVKTYCYYATRTKPGEDKTRLWRFPANEIDKAVLNTISGHLEKPVTCATETSGDWQKLTDLNAATADILRKGSTVAQRELLLELAATVQLREDAVHIRLSTSSNREAAVLTVPAKLVRKGHQLKLVVPSDNRGPAASTDPVLVKLIAQAFAARDYLVEGTQHPCVSGYSKRHLNRLARLAWLAPDIISDILNGRQPAHLTGRYLVRCGEMPIDWSSQREFLGFA